MTRAVLLLALAHLYEVEAAPGARGEVWTPYGALQEADQYPVPTLGDLMVLGEERREALAQAKEAGAGAATKRSVERWFTARRYFQEGGRHG